MNKKTVFIGGVGDDQGYAWAIAKSLAEQGYQIILGVWPPIYRIFMHSWKSGHFDSSRVLSSGNLFAIEKIYPLDVLYDSPEDVPEEIRKNKRYAALNTGYTLQEVAESVQKDFGTIHGIVHALANAPEIKKPLLETSREGYLSAISASSYSLVAMLRFFGPFCQGAALSLSYLASERVVPGYGGGMSSAKAALEADTRYLAYEAGQRWNIRVNTISAGPLASRAARAIGMIHSMIEQSKKWSPLNREMHASDVGDTAAFLLSPQAAAITGVTLYVDNGLHMMHSPSSPLEAPPPSRENLEESNTLSAH